MRNNSELYIIANPPVKTRSFFIEIFILYGV